MDNQLRARSYTQWYLGTLFVEFFGLLSLLIAYAFTSRPELLTIAKYTLPSAIIFIGMLSLITGISVKPVTSKSFFQPWSELYGSLFSQTRTLFSKKFAGQLIIGPRARLGGIYAVVLGLVLAIFMYFI